MPSATHDGRSFLIDGKRIWLVSGRIPYARLPRESWQDRILAARSAGLNTVETPVFWDRHESRPGKFDFTGDNDLRHFVDLVAKAGMYCILGLGPYVGSEWDCGGLPAWLPDISNVRLRTYNGPFLEACSRFFTAVADQIKGWQVTAPGSGGPIVLLQLENSWSCGHPTLANQYLGELTRYVREAGLNVPIINSNNMWHSVEGQIDGWSGNGPMLGTIRQLATVRTNQPRLVIDLNFATHSAWGTERHASIAGRLIERRLAEVTAVGGQFNLTSFCGGTNFGFFGGRSGESPDRFATASASDGCLIDETGRATDALGDVRRIMLAASKFGRVFSHLDPAFQPVTVEPPEQGKRRPGERSCAVLHSIGSQGGVVFVFGDEPERDKADLRVVPLVLPDGASLHVPVRSNGVAWCFMGINVSGRAKLDYANVSAIGNVGQTLVLFGPAGAGAVVCINGSPIESDVPGEDEAPEVLTHEGLTVVLLNEAQATSTYFTDDAVYVGVAGLNAAGGPIPSGDGSYLRVGADGHVKTATADTAKKRRRAGKVVLSSWSTALIEDYLDGTSARYAAISGPASLTSLGCPFGYGWYRLRPAVTHKARVAFPYAGDRLHFYQEGRWIGLVGAGPGAERDITLPLGKNAEPIIVLAENMGRFCEGVNLGESKGLFGEAYEVSQIRVGKPEVEIGEPLDILAFRSPLWELSQGDATSPERVTWTLPHRKKAPVLMTIDQPPAGALLVVNGKAVSYVDRSGPTRIVLSEEHLHKGNNSVQLALVVHGIAEDECRRLAALVHFDEIEASILAGGEMAFAKWEPPPASAFQAKAGHHAAATPAWHRCTFEASPADGPLILEPHGLTKGQVYVNGRHLCRYFVATASGKHVPPQVRYVIPASWFKDHHANELLIFDEHGGNASRCTLAHAPR